MVINTPNIKKAEEYANKNNEKIKSQYLSLFKKRQEKYMFNNARQKQLEKHLIEDYGWSIKIPWGWNIIRESPDSNFIWLGKEFPYQWISIQWQYLNSPLDSSIVNDLIFEFPMINYNNIQFNTYKFSLTQGHEGNWFHWKASGIRVSIQEAKGGPFSMFIKIDELNKEVFISWDRKNSHFFDFESGERIFEIS